MATRREFLKQGGEAAAGGLAIALGAIRVGGGLGTVIEETLEGAVAVVTQDQGKIAESAEKLLDSHAPIDMVVGGAAAAWGLQKLRNILPRG